MPASKLVMVQNASFERFLGDTVVGVALLTPPIPICR